MLICKISVNDTLYSIYEIPGNQQLFLSAHNFHIYHIKLYKKSERAFRACILSPPFKMSNNFYIHSLQFIHT